MKRINTNPAEYVVFDVETNGLKPKQHDLLSISFYKPDDGKEYCKFLPLELNHNIITTPINGINEKDLIDATALTQIEFDHIIEEFELEKRTILIYAGGNFDALFLSAYLKRHQIWGYDKLTFYNFKKNLIPLQGILSLSLFLGTSGFHQKNNRFMGFTFFRHNQFQFNQKIFCTHLGIKIINQIRLVNKVYFKLGVPTFFNLISYEPGLSCLPRFFNLNCKILPRF